jgi:phenylpropionate dioxygenase-like ring-hydroxylating dioxygenase large terminal subunit
MDTAVKFDCQAAWYPVFYERDLDKRRPHRFELLGEPVVLWWDGQWRAFADRCPHRLASLSEGRINEEGNLECPYHGWSFDGEGNCRRIPQQPSDGNAHTSPRACAQVYATTVKQGLVFVYGKGGEPGDTALVPIVPTIEEEPQDWVLIDTFRDLPYDAFTLLENVLDSSHLPFTHHKSVGNRANAAPMELEILESGRSGFVGFWAEGPRQGKLGSQTTKFVAPNLMWHDLTSAQFGRTLTVVYATPIAKGKCRLFARFPFKFPSPLPRLVFRLTPRWLSHLGQNAILEDDQIFLHHQERYFNGRSREVAKVFYLPTKADLFVLEFHKWIDRYGVDPFPGQSLPPMQTKDELLDRYHSHTELCASCRGALQNIDRIRTVCIVLILLSFVLGLSLPRVGVTIGLLGFVLWYGLGELRTKFYRGRAIPPRNR